MRSSSDKADVRAYSALARHYESLSGDLGGAEWAAWIAEGLAALSPGRRGVDLGCGSGFFTRALARAGYSVYGTDSSREMLAEAERKNGEGGIRVDYVLQDVRKFRPLSRLDFAVAVNDVFNYLSPEELSATLSRIRAGLVKGGILYFDLSSPEKIRDVLGNNAFFEDGEDVTYLWLNELSPDRGSVKMELVIFEREGEMYRRKSETHVQYAHERRDVAPELDGAGFALRVPPRRFKEDGSRLYFWAQAI